MPLFAAADFDLIIKAILGIIFLIVAVLNQLLVKKPVIQQGLRPPNVPPLPPNAANPPGNAQNEIEEFLRRVGNQPAVPPRPVAPPPVARPVRRLARTQQPKAGSPPRRSLAAEALPVEVVQQPESVDAYVRERMDTGAFQQRAEHLSETGERADSQMEAHLKSAFDHKVGTLAGREMITSEADTTPTSGAGSSMGGESNVSPAAASLIKMFADPSNRRNAIILNEILNRPEQRW